MPRASPEARAAAAWRGGGRHPKPPRFLSAGAKDLWREIVEERPIDFFRSGALTLLTQFCEMAVAQEVNLRAMQENPLNPKYQRLVRDMANSLNMTAAKLRLSIQSALRTESAMLDERAFRRQRGEVLTA
jgi:hypothetical protein